MYTVVAGEERPLTVRVGNVERGSGSTIINERGETLSRRGEIGFPNGTQIWAARVIDGEIPKNAKGEYIQVSVTDPNYKGELKSMKWGAPGGSLTSVRYLKGYNSRDVIYQERVLNFKVDESNENSADIYMITLENGENDLDDKIDSIKIEHLKSHPYNKDSESGDPEFSTKVFYEKTYEQKLSMETKDLDVQFEAAKIVREAGTGGDSIGKIKNLFSIVRSVTDEEQPDDKLYSYLLMIADRKSQQFINAVDNYKKNVSNTFEKLKSYDAIDLTTNGTIIAFGKNKKQEIIMDDVPGKGEEMLDYLLENFTDPKAFEATFKLIQITDKLK